MQRPNGRLAFAGLEPDGSTFSSQKFISDSHHKVTFDNKPGLQVKTGETQRSLGSRLPYFSTGKQKDFFASRSRLEISHTFRKHNVSDNAVNLKTPLKLTDWPHQKARFSFQRDCKSLPFSASSRVSVNVDDTSQSLEKNDCQDTDTFDFLCFASVNVNVVESVPDSQLLLFNEITEPISFDLEKRVLSHSNPINENSIDDHDDPMDVDENENIQASGGYRFIVSREDSFKESPKLGTLEADPKTKLLDNESETYPVKDENKQEQCKSVDVCHQSAPLSKSEFNSESKNRSPTKEPLEGDKKNEMVSGAAGIVEGSVLAQGNVDNAREKVEKSRLASCSSEKIEGSPSAKVAEKKSKDEVKETDVASGSLEIMEDSVVSLTTLEVVETILAMRNSCFQKLPCVVRKAENEIIDLTDLSNQSPSEDPAKQATGKATSVGTRIANYSFSSCPALSENYVLKSAPKDDTRNGALMRSQCEDAADITLFRALRNGNALERKQKSRICVKKKKTNDETKEMMVNMNTQMKEETKIIEIELRHLKSRHNTTMKKLKHDLDSSTKLNASLSEEVKELRAVVEQMRTNMTTMQNHEQTVIELKSNINELKTAFLQANRKSEKTLVESKQLRESITMLNGAVFQLEAEKVAAETEAREIAETARKTSSYAKQLVARARQQVTGAENEAFRLQKFLQDETYRKNKLASQAAAVRKQVLQAALETTKWEEDTRNRIERLDAKLQKLEEQKRSMEQRQRMLKAKRLADVQKYKERMKKQIKRESCIICFSKPVSIVFVPCGHRSVCPDCAPRMTRCPMCRQDIQMQVKSFDAGIART
eukprot:CAMPEP_0204877120 /NCGR_PEP_ID=MMETSP1348-20121228/48019_1 /ASSEMBLY_ACC=CAM_ASM_000700 /TAXON_ID=215587 /ORGANISM="Aplanochytrium stocchinoi, Strain GSBS06" /LENGTH=824 /DNA_ID=CAMNT_0052033959 /DNA_START=74 /DNA_END=2549 /DNA_ORIENTATION=+